MTAAIIKTEENERQPYKSFGQHATYMIYLNVHSLCFILLLYTTIENNK